MSARPPLFARVVAFAAGAVLSGVLDAQEHASRLSDVPVAPRTDAVPDRPKPLLELGDPFLGAGVLHDGVVIPTGAVWQPSLLVFGTWRTALQLFDPRATTAEWANRLDVFANLQLSGTERILVGFRPLDDNGRFTRYQFSPDADSAGGGWQGELDGRPETLFFEGDFGELFPGLDPTDSGTADWGFAVGRQPLVFQEGLLVDDTIDALGVTRNTLLPRGTSNLRVTGLWGWNDVGRDDNREDASAHLFGLFSETDLRSSTVAFDTAWVLDEEDRSDALYLGLGSVQRVGHWNTAFRGVTSVPFRGDTSEVQGGTLLLAELSRAVTGSSDIGYFNAFVGIRDFSSAARGPDAGGPLGRVGILFEAVGLGSYGSALDNSAKRAAGASAGYQMFLEGPEEDPRDHRAQLVLELGGRVDTDGSQSAAVAAGARYQRALGRHLILRVDGFVAAREGLHPATGGRVELALKF